MEIKPAGYFDFTVYPLEGVWDINEAAKKHFSGTIKKKDLVYQLMIRQPDFVDEHLYCEMLHLGPFENESVSFDAMESFAQYAGHTRLSKVHREIYLSDTRKVAPEKLKTLLRFQVS